MSYTKTIADVIFVKGVNINGTLLSSAASGNAGSLLIGDDNSYGGSFTPASATIKGALSGIGTSLSTKMSTDFSNASGVLGVTNGGTGQSTAFAATAALSPLTTKGDLWGFSTFNTRIPVGTNGQVLVADSTQALGVRWGTTSGTVSSVAASVPPYMTVTGSPITTTGTLAFDFATQASNLFFASPDGSSGPPGFRAIVAADIPILNQNTTGSAGSLSGIVALINGGTGVSAASPNAAFNALSPMSAAGDIIYNDATPSAAALPIGTTGQVLTVVGGLPAWAASTGNPSSGTLGAIQFSDGAGGFLGDSTNLFWDNTGKVLHIAPTSSSTVMAIGNAAYISTFGGDGFMHAGATLNGGAWTATSTTAAISYFSVGGGIGAGSYTIFTNQGLTIGSGFAPIPRFDVGPTGIVDILTNVLDMNSNKIVDVADPTAPQDAMTLAYADANYAPIGATGSQVELFTLTGTDITNGFVTLASTPSVAAATILLVASAPNQFYGVDFTVSGAQLSWTGLGLDGILTSGDHLTVIHN